MTFFEDNDDEQIMIVDLVKKMEQFLQQSESDSYIVTYMKKKLLDRYGDQIIVTEINGKSNVVTFRRTAASILHDFYDKQRMEHAESETMRIIDTAAKLIKSDIKSMVASYDSYLNKEHLSSADVLQFLPESLHRLLQLMFVGQDTDLKQASIGQAIMQAVRPSPSCTIEVWSFS